MSELSRSFFNDIRQIIKQARQKAYTTVNFAMVEAYWHIGRRIVSDEILYTLRRELSWSHSGSLCGWKAPLHVSITWEK